jgi:hypothetical protein
MGVLYAHPREESYMFSRGNWAVIGIDPNSYPEFERSLNDASLMLVNSQLTASVIARLSNIPSVGINPYDRPRLDQDAAGHIDRDTVTRLAEYAAVPQEDRPDFNGIDSVEDFFRYGVNGFRIQEGVKRFGFWLVYNDAKDVGDVKSLKEDIAYKSMYRPYSFLSVGEKRSIENEAKIQSATTRKQVPVLVDFENGRVFVETTTKNIILMLRQVLRLFGVETKSVSWSFGSNDWIRPFLTKLREDSFYKNQFAKRAEEVAKFEGGEIEKDDNPEIEAILSEFYSTTQLETEEWISFRTPAQIRLFPHSVQVTAQTPVSATALLNATETAHVYGTSIAVQERKTVVKRKTQEEKTYRSTIFTLEVWDGMNEIEAGAALLRGFDLPGFKKGIVREIRKAKEVPKLSRFWLDWLVGLESSVESFTNAVKLTLGFDRAEAGSIGIVAYGGDEDGSDDVLAGDE